MSDRNGVSLAVEAAGGGSDGFKVLAELLGTSVPFIYNCQRKGFFPPDRAKKIAERYPQLDLKDLVSPRIRDLL